jgi:hypothetical protein
VEKAQKTRNDGGSQFQSFFVFVFRALLHAPVRPCPYMGWVS